MNRQPSKTVDPSPELVSDAGDLWKAFHSELWGFARKRLDSDAAVDDVLQTAFLRAHQALSDGNLPRQPRAWLFQIVRNLVRDSYRSRSRAQSLEGALKLELKDSEPLDDEHDREVFELVARTLPRFIDQLKSPYREALQLTELEELSQIEAARRAGVSLSCMKTRVRRGREQIHTALLRCCVFERDGRGRMTECSPRSDGTPCGSCN